MSNTDQSTDTPANEPVPTEVREATGRRIYSAEYKRQIVAEITAAPRGEVGVILRREGLYAATVSNWRAESSQTGPRRKPGRPASTETPLKRENERLKRENQRLERKLEQAALIIAVQKKVSQLLNLPTEESPETD